MKYYLILLVIATSSLFSQVEELTPLWQGNYDSYDVDFSPNGELLAIGDEYATYIVNSLTGEQITELPLEYEYTPNLKFTPDGSMLVVASFDLLKSSNSRNNLLILFDTENWEAIDTLRFLDQEFKHFTITDIDITKNDNYIVIAGANWGFAVYNLETKELKTWSGAPKVEDNRWSTSCRWVSTSYDSRYLMASFPFWKTVKIFDIETLEEVKEYKDVYRGEFNPVKDEFFVQKSVNDKNDVETLDQLAFYDFNFDTPVLEIHPQFSSKIYRPVINYSKQGKYLMYIISGSLKIYNLERSEINLEFNGGAMYFKYNHFNNTLIRGGGDIIVYDAVGVLSSEIQNSEHDIIISPNPANEFININYTFENPVEFEITINDVTGNQLEIIDSGFGIGEYKKQYNISQLASGTYFLTLSINGNNITNQIIKE